MVIHIHEAPAAAVDQVVVQRFENIEGAIKQLSSVASTMLQQMQTLAAKVEAPAETPETPPAPPEA